MTSDDRGDRADYVERRTAHDMFACAWSRTMPSGAPAPRVVPDGCADVLWHRESGRLFVAGPDTHAHQTATAPGLLVAVRFRPGRAPAGLGVPADALRDGRVDLASVWAPARARQLADELAESATPGRLLAATVAGFGGSWDPFVPAVVALARRGVSVREMASVVGVTERQLHRRSLAAFGYGAKVLTRVLRFDRAVRLARSGVALAAVAAEVGCSDQAHLSREVRGLAGVPLTALLG